MTLTSGSRLGPFEIIAPLGAGGMGEVYKARDTRLNRTVAIKVLSSEVTFDRQAHERFQREAHAISALNHPRICTLYDVGTHEGTEFLVMEYLAGETLAQRLSSRNGRGLPLPEALQLAAGIAEAFAVAHQHGVIHRDLKPANVMVSNTGVKLLDFGIARLRAGLRGSSDQVDAPTSETPLTGAGMVIGTPHYLAPEQLAGEEADERSDIFAFGAVLFEMIAGRRAFDAPTDAGVITAVLADPPSLEAACPAVPSAVTDIVTACLARDPNARWQSAHDIVLHLHSLTGGRHDVRGAPPAAPGRMARWWTVGLAATVAAFALGASVFRAAPPASEPVALDVVPPADTSLLTTSASIPAAQIAVSPDGRRLAFVGAGMDGQAQLYVRTLASGMVQLVAGTQGAGYPFWSADSRSIGFFAAGKLQRSELGGNPPQVICDAGDGRGAAWNADGVIVFAIGAGGLWRVPATGGTPTPLTTLDKERAELAHRWPSFLPDGRRFLYVSRAPTSTLQVASLDGGAPKILTNTLFAGAVAHGHLLFLRNRALVAQPFDLERLELSGDPVVIAPQVGASSVGHGAFSASTTTVLAFAGDLAAPGQLTWFDRGGNASGTIGSEADYLDFELSPDMRRLLAARVDGSTATSDVWLVDLAARHRVALDHRSGD